MNIKNRSKNILTGYIGIKRKVNDKLKKKIIGWIDLKHGL